MGQSASTSTSLRSRTFFTNGLPSDPSVSSSTLGICSAASVQTIMSRKLVEELDSEYLIIWDGFEGKPWSYRNSAGGGAPYMRLESRRALKYDATGIPSDLYYEHGSDVLYCYGMICRGYTGPNHGRSKLPIHSYSLSPLQS